MIRSTRHSLKFTNTKKRDTLKLFLDACREAAQRYLDHLWNNGYSYQSGDKQVDFSIQQNLLNCPKMIDYKAISFDTPLSARALSSVATQVCGIVSSATKKQAKRLFVLEALKRKGQDTSNLENKILNTKLVKPTLPENFSVELSSKCADIKKTKGHFGYFLRLSSLGKPFGHLKIPIKKTKLDVKWESGVLLGSFLVSKNFIDLRYQKDVPLNTTGLSIGADQGINTLLTLSDGQSTDNLVDQHLWTNKKIYAKLTRQKRGSKANKRTQRHLKNHLGFCLNRLDFSKISKINLEDMTEVRRGKRQTKRTSYFNPGVINERLVQKAESLGVQVELVQCTYRSQRCSKCGWVQKLNRNSKIFSCKKCSFKSDSDLNAAENLNAELCYIPIWLRQRQFNLKGFYWLVGQELESLTSQNQLDI